MEDRLIDRIILVLTFCGSGTYAGGGVIVVPDMIRHR